MSVCPNSSGEHTWVYSVERSDFGVARYECCCGAVGGRQRVIKEKNGNLRNVGAKIVEYAPDSRYAKARRPVVKEPKYTANLHAGKNGSGHKLPSSGGSRGR